MTPPQPQPPQSIALVTPSYAPDLELCADLHDSVLRHTGADVEHHIIVPVSDMEAFGRLAGPRTYIRDVRDYLPRTLMRVPRGNVWLNLRQPWPPVRGWIAQQIVKLAAAAATETDIVLLVDSDIVLIRTITARSFSPTGVLELFEVPDAVDGSLPRHRLWHAAARRLLGLPPAEATPLPDYVCCPCAWSPAIVRMMLARIEAVTGVGWATAVGRELHFSEMILYGVYVREIFTSSQEIRCTEHMRCLNHYDEVPLGEEQLEQLLTKTGGDDLAVMISAKSGTELSVRRKILAGFRPTAG